MTNKTKKQMNKAQMKKAKGGIYKGRPATTAAFPITVPTHIGLPWQCKKEGTTFVKVSTGVVIDYSPTGASTGERVYWTGSTND